MILQWALIVLAAFGPPFAAVAIVIATPSGDPARRRILALTAACATGGLFLAVDLAVAAWPAVSVAGAWTARAGLELWRGRPPRRKRTRRTAGARGRAVIAAMVAALRDLARPRPVLKPAPVPR